MPTGCRGSRFLFIKSSYPVPMRSDRIEPMTNANDNQDKQLLFPIQKVDVDDHSQPFSLVYQTLKLEVTEKMNEFAAGKFQFTISQVKQIEDCSADAIDLGYPPLLNKNEMSQIYRSLIHGEEQ
jgi:hypothetical protein